MKKIFAILPVAAILLCTACSKKSTTEVVTAPAGTTMASTNIVEILSANRNDAEQVTGRISMDLSAGKQKVEVGGSIKMKRDDVIQISLQVFGFVEAGRLELTPDYFLILNRIGKQYVKAAYKDIPFFKENDIDFYSLQALIWNELFLTGEKDNRNPTGNSYSQFKDSQNHVILTHTSKQQLALKFITDMTTHTLQQTNVTAQNGGSLQCNYDSWARLGRRDFPDKMELNINVDKTPIKAKLELSRLRTNEKWTDTRTSIDKKKLKQVSLQQAFNQILSLSN